ncbi:MAG: hypothetical protein JKX88_04070 [Marinicaulis sp.]|nr:hypothetical protein [Marinicaulis sp.]
MSTTTDIDTELEAYLAPTSEDQITPEHRAWMNAEIQKTMDKKARGEANYTPLETVRAEFGL